MPVNSGEALKLVNMFGRGFVLNNIPSMAKGILVEYLKRYNVTFRELVEAVSQDANLWAMVDTREYARIQAIALKIGEIDWFTPEWIIEAIRNDFPSFASLFLSDRKSLLWLTRQVEEVKTNIERLKNS
ncbi:MAG: hypothetical protein PHN44_00635 [Candidatus Marinimicrobia bacterium]|nr:hypothetical protein [Candidatus Neomarinimicrobiota bacterium]MDD5539128.1 hypothetical protein [Candidatus Neomarinimicrobiota bacterium]